LTHAGRPGRGGRATQPERTTLAWTRTSLAVLANGLLLLFRGTHAYIGTLQMVAAGVAGLLAASTYLVGLRRQRLLARRPLPDRISPRREVYLTALSVAGLILISEVALMV
jgi:uncharacterized membrane protein YidH (DUF202 family)